MFKSHIRKCEEVHIDVGPVEVTPSPRRATVALTILGLAVAALVAGATMATQEPETMRRLQIQETPGGSLGSPGSPGWRDMN